MWSTSSIFVFACTVAAALAALAIYPLETKPDYYQSVPGCYISELDVVVGVGERIASRSSCMQYICYSDHVTHATCGAVAAGDGCSVVAGDLTLLYPECCPTVTCT